MKSRTGLGKPGKASHLTIRAALVTMCCHCGGTAEGYQGRERCGEGRSAHAELLMLSDPHRDFLWAKLSLRLSGLRNGEGWPAPRSPCFRRSRAGAPRPRPERSETAAISKPMWVLPTGSLEGEALGGRQRLPGLHTRCQNPTAQSEAGWSPGGAVSPPQLLGQPGVLPICHPKQGPR